MSYFIPNDPKLKVLCPNCGKPMYLAIEISDKNVGYWKCKTDKYVTRLIYKEDKKVENWEDEDCPLCSGTGYQTWAGNLYICSCWGTGKKENLVIFE